MAIVLIDLGVVASLLDDPRLLFSVQFALELAIIFEDGTLVRIVVTVPDIVGTLGNFLWPADVICD